MYVMTTNNKYNGVRSFERILYVNHICLIENIDNQKQNKTKLSLL